MSALILGHKNPDSDSIISAIACAHLYKQRGLDVVPAAQGTPAPETAFILERFGLEAPEIVSPAATSTSSTTPTRPRLPPTLMSATSRASSTITSSAT